MQVHLVLPHGSKFLVDPQPGLRDDANDVPQMPRAMPWDSIFSCSDHAT